MAPWYHRGMEYVVLEREFSAPLTPDEVRKMAAETQCLDLYRVKPVRSYLMPGGQRMICVFLAPDAEALRAVSRSNGFENAVIWPSTVHTP
jgi:hypothetical protein